MYLNVAGFSPEVHNHLIAWIQVWKLAASLDLPPLPPKKVFKPKHNLPVLEDYRDKTFDARYTVKNFFFHQEIV